MYLPEDSSKGLENEGTEQVEALDTNSSEQPEESQGAGEQGQEDLSTEVDISKLSPEAQKIVKGFQATFTKRTQAIAENKKSLEAKEKQIDEFREKYEQKLYELTQPKGKEEPLVDISQMNAEQKQAWDMLNKHFDKKLEQVRKEEREAVQVEIGQLKGYVGNLEWRQFAKDNPGANKYRDSMRDLQKQKGGINCPLTLDELLVLTQKDDLKKLGAEEYKRSVQTKKTKITTKPTSTAGEETEIGFDKTPGRNPQKFRENLKKAWDKASEVVGGK